MPFRLNEHRAKIQFVTSAETPMLCYDACQKLGVPSMTVYIQRALCEALSRDLDIPIGDLLARLPETRPNSGMRAQRNVGPTNTVEEVK